MSDDVSVSPLLSTTTIKKKMVFDNKQKLSEHQQLRPHAHFAAGSDVEVTSNEEGFRDIWFSAKLISLPSKTNKSKYLVEYKTLVSDENGSNPLVELVDISLLRPALPVEKGEDEASFEVSDVVEACHLDGWWIGVVIEVLGERSYRVFFNNPPDEVVFDRSSLRPHKDWVDGKWVRPEKQTTDELMLYPGRAVEVNLNTGNSPDIWYPGTVVKEIGKRYFMVDYRSSNDANVLRAAVDYLHIRPSPPRCNNNIFQLLDKVDAFCNFGWLSGVITKVLDDGKYIVYFKQTQKEMELSHTDLRVPIAQINGKWVHPMQDITVISNAKVDLDPNLNRNGKISLPPENFGGANESAEISRNIQQEPAANSEKTYVDNRTNPENFGGVNERLCEKQNEESLPDRQYLGVVGTQAIMPDDQNDGSPASLETPTSDKEDNASMETQGENLDFSTDKRASSKKRRKRGRRRALITAIKTPRKSSIKTPSASVKGSTPVEKNALVLAVPDAICENNVNEGDLASNLNDIKDASIIPIEKVKGTPDKKIALNHAVIDGISENTLNGGNHEKEELPDKGTSPKRKKGTPRDRLTMQGKANVDNTEEMLRIIGGTETIRKSTRKRKSVYESIVIALKPTRKKPRMTTETLSSTQEYEDSLKCKANSQPVSNNDSGYISETDRPLSSWLIESRSPLNVDLTQSEEEKTHVPIETLEQNDVDTAVTAMKMLPFTKTSPVWKMVESMEVFQQIPQDPHFQPLYETKQDCREGLAIGYMVTFSGLVEKISKLHFGDPGKVFDDCLETLSDLERHGFNVEPIRARLKELISIKGGHENSQMVIDEVKKQIEEQQRQKAIIDEERNEIDKKISELRMKRELVVSRAEKLEFGIEELESRMESVKGEIQAVQAEFEKVVTAPW